MAMQHALQKHSHCSHCSWLIYTLWTKLWWNYYDPSSSHLKEVWQHDNWCCSDTKLSTKARLVGVPAGIVKPPTACPNWPTIRFPILVNKITFVPQWRWNPLEISAIVSRQWNCTKKTYNLKFQTQPHERKNPIPPVPSMCSLSNYSPDKTIMKKCTAVSAVGKRSNSPIIKTTTAFQ